MRKIASLLILSFLAAIPGRDAQGEAIDFGALVEAHAEAVVEERRWLHANPELSLRETGTQAWMRDQLGKIPGIEWVEGTWGTGLVAILRGGRPGPLVAYRADMDALPIREATGLPFASTRTDTLSGRSVGVMHACGHDIHMAVLVGVARVLSAVRESMPGSVMLILEPAEEIGAGSDALIRAGVFSEGRMPAAIFAIHNHPTLLYGQVGYCPGRSSANVDAFKIKIAGKGGHGAYPHKTVDPITIAARVVLAYQAIVGREIDSVHQAVISVGSIHGGTTSNVIPDTVEVTGTVRCHEPEVREQLQIAIIRTTKGIAHAAGAPEPVIDYILGTPSMYNHPRLVEEALPVLRKVVGSENVIQYQPALGGEDFSRFQQVIPGFMFRVGVGRPEKEMTLHSAEFDPDERAIPLAVHLVSEVLWSQLHRQSP